MPAPVSSNNSSVYDPSLQLSPVDGCDPSNSSCAAFPTVDVPPVHIEGDAGKQALLKLHEQGRCDSQSGAAALSCLAVAAVASQGSPVAAFVASLVCGKDAGALVHCREASAQQTAAVIQCEARDGTPIVSARENEIICLVPAP